MIMNSAVFDSTVLISAFLTPSGVAGELIDLAGFKFHLCLSPHILIEVREVLLTRPKLRKGGGYADIEVEGYCRALEELAEEINTIPPLSGVVRDPNDDMIIATAVAAKADYVVSRDKDLLSLGVYEGIQMIAPEAFMRMLREGSKE